MNDMFLISKMQESDIDELVKIDKICFSSPWSYNSFKAELENKNSYFIVCKYNNKAIGYAGLYKILDETYISNIALLPDYRKKGIGRKLLVSLINYAQNNRASFISLEVRKSNYIAINLYKSEGFVLSGLRKNFYSSPKEDGLIMTKYFI